MRFVEASAPGAASVVAAYRGERSLWERLKVACAAEWERYLRNDFIWQLADGTLDPRAYRHWVEQDYIYCIHYCRGYALAAFKADSVADMRAFMTTMSRVLEQELELHRGLLRGWGMTDADIDALPEASASLAYTRYVLDVGMAGDVLDLLVALSVCVVGYAEIGTLLINHPSTRLEGNPCRAWIEQYAGDDYQSIARHARAQLDSVADRRLTEQRFADLTRIFAQTVKLDIEFWEMAYRRTI